VTLFDLGLTLTGPLDKSTTGLIVTYVWWMGGPFKLVC